MIILWTQSANTDLEDNILYIAKDSINIAMEKYELFKDKVQALKVKPKIGRIISELKIHNIVKYRELIINPWRIFYKIEEKNVYILAIIDGRRNVADILLERNLR